MSKTCSSIAIRICALIAVLSCAFSLNAGIDPNYSLNIKGRLLCAVAFVIPLGIASILIAHRSHDENQRQKIYHIFWVILFLYYILQLGYMLFFASEFARQNHNIFDGNYIYNLMLQWEYSTNLIPFKTINLMLNAYQIELSYVANVNLLGNLAAFMPFAFFLPKLFPSMQKPKKFLISMALIIISVEVLQLFTLSGTLDIDDFILNMTGASCFYFVLKIPVCKRMMKPYKIQHIIG